MNHVWIVIIFICFVGLAVLMSQFIVRTKKLPKQERKKDTVSYTYLNTLVEDDDLIQYTSTDVSSEKAWESIPPKQFTSRYT